MKKKPKKRTKAKMWLIKPKKPQNELRVFQGELAKGLSAVIRASYFKIGLDIVKEVSIKDYGDFVLNAAKFAEVVSVFLQGDADVYVYIECDPIELGLEDP